MKRQAVRLCLLEFLMVQFRKRFPVEEAAKINEQICTGKWPEEQRNVDRNDTENPGAGEETAQGKEGHSPGEEKRKEEQGKERIREH